MSFDKTLRIFAAAVLALTLAACESSEERAEKHFKSGMELLETGDVERALVEFRNVLQLNEGHIDARLAYANAVLARGSVGEAYGHFLKVSETNPDDIETRVTLAELAAQGQSWDEAKRHYDVAVSEASEDPRIKAVGLALAYRDAVDDDSLEARRGVATQAEALVEEAPDNILLRRILIDTYSRDQRLGEALEQLDIAIGLEPNSRRLQNARVVLLAQVGDGDQLENRLKEMVEAFPGDAELEQSLIRFYLSQGRVDAAETFLKERAATSGENDKIVDYVRFVSQARGTDAALEVAEAELAKAPDNLILVALASGLMFEAGQRDEGIKRLEAGLVDAEPGESTNRARVALSRMLLTTGNEVGARRLVEEVLEADSGNVDALKLSAGWLIEADKPEEAISALRTALDQAPDDADTMTLMAQAHQRNGSRELARDMLALATEASRNAPDKSIRYARVLASENNLRAAEDVLINSLRLNENNIDILSALGQIYVQEKDWARATQVGETLRRIDTEASNSTADAIQVAILAGQDRTDETVAFLEQLAQQDGNSTGAQIAIARAKLASGDQDGAVKEIEDAVARNPGSPVLRYASGAIYAAVGKFENAEQAYRDLLVSNPKAERIWLELIRVQNAQGKRDEAMATLDEGLEALPGAPNLQWARASVLEQAGDYEGAISVYEELYEVNSNSPVVANNLASLITTYREDQESLDRAYAVAKRLKGSDVPQFQDTFGWIAYRRGELNEALENLEPAAAALRQDALVQFHLAMTYLGLERKQEALDQFRLAVDTAGEADLRPQFAEARRHIGELEAELKQ